MAEVAIYARFSSGRQREESIEDQVRVCREEAERQGDTVVAVYDDHAISGTSTAHRAAFAKMISDSATGRFEKVYVYKVDRFARNRYDSAVYKSKLRKNGVTVVSATERIQDGPDGILLESLLEGMAEYYSANLAENVRRGMHGNALKCKHNGMTVYGYDNQKDGTFKVNDQEADVVRRMYRMYLDGAGFPEIEDALSGYRTRRGNRFGKTTISKMLRQEKYAGTYRYDDVVVEDGMPAIISKSDFDRVQARLGRRTRKRYDHESYPFKGKVFDTDGNPYQSESGHSKSGQKHCYYKCRVTRHALRKSDLEADVLGAVEKAVSIPGVSQRLAEMIYALQRDAIEEDAKAIDEMADAVERNRREQERAVDLALKIGVNDALARKIKDLEREGAQLKQELSDMRRGMPVLDADHIQYWVEKVMARGQAGDSVFLLVSQVIIDRDRNELHVRFTFEEKDEHPQVDGCSDEYTMVDCNGLTSNTLPIKVYVMPYGFGILARMR